MRAYHFVGFFALSLIGSATASMDFDQISKVENGLPALMGRQVGGGQTICSCTTCQVTTPGESCCSGGASACCGNASNTCACCVGGSCGCVGCDFGCTQ